MINVDWSNVQIEVLQLTAARGGWHLDMAEILSAPKLEVFWVTGQSFMTLEEIPEAVCEEFKKRKWDFGLWLHNRNGFGSESLRILEQLDLYLSRRKTGKKAVWEACNTLV